MRSTQLYAKAGTVIKVIISKELVGKISVGKFDFKYFQLFFFVKR